MSPFVRKDDRNALMCAAQNGSLTRILKKYLRSCHAPPEADPKKEPGRLPNLAGFCSMLGCGISCAEELQKQIPAAYDYIRAVLEDEALNSTRPPALLNTYLKERLGYGEKNGAECEESVWSPVFEHDILEDGA